MRTLPYLEGFERTIFFSLIGGFAAGTRRVPICLLSLGQKVQSLSRPGHQLGHAIHAPSLSQRAALQGFVGALVGSAFQHGSLEFLACRIQSIHDRIPLDLQVLARRKEAIARVSRRNRTVHSTDATAIGTKRRSRFSTFDQHAHSIYIYGRSRLNVGSSSGVVCMIMIMIMRKDCRPWRRRRFLLPSNSRLPTQLGGMFHSFSVLKLRSNQRRGARIFGSFWRQTLVHERVTSDFESRSVLQVRVIRIF